jgi:hypothetical protein
VITISGIRYTKNVIFLGPEWHMIFGGCDASFNLLQSVELYNWKTGQQCQFSPLPHPIGYPVSTIMGDTAAYCGGFRSAQSVSECFMLEKSTNLWVQVWCLFIKLHLSKLTV